MMREFVEILWYLNKVTQRRTSGYSVDVRTKPTRLELNYFFNIKQIFISRVNGFSWPFSLLTYANPDSSNSRGPVARSV